MLQKIREKMMGSVAVVIIVLIGITFVFWGVDFGTGGRDVVAVVNGDEIPRREFEQAYQTQLFQVQEMYEGNVPDDVRRDLRDRVIESLIQQRLLLQRVEERGYRVPDDMLAESIQSLDAFRVGDTFSIDTYRARLRSLGMTPEMFERDQRQALAVDQLQDAVARSGFYTPAEFRRYLEIAFQQREFDWLRIPVADFAERVDPPGDDEVREYYEANVDDYLRPESVDLEYVSLTLGDVAAGIEVDEQTLRDHYERTVGEAVHPEQRRAAHILITAEDRSDAEAQALAESLRQRLDDGEDFAELAREYSDDGGTADDGGDLGWAEPGFFVPEFEEALFALGEGELAGPVETMFGYHLIRVDEIRQDEAAPFEEMREQLREEYLSDRVENEFIDRANALADAAFEHADDLDAIARDEGLEVRQLSGFTREGAPEFDNAAPVVDAAFSEDVLFTGQVSPLVQVSDEQVLLLRVLDHQPAEPRPLEEVADGIRDQLRRQAAARLASETGSEVLRRLGEGESLQALAEELELQYSPPVLLTRQEFNGTPPELLFDVFGRPRPATTAPGSVQLGNGDYAVYVLRDVIPGDPEGVPQFERDMEKERMAEQTGYQDFGLYLRAIELDSRVRRPTEALEELQF